MKQVGEKLQSFLPSNREAFRQQGLITFNKLIRIKNAASVQEDPIHGGGGKEPGSLQVIDLNNLHFLRILFVGV